MSWVLSFAANAAFLSPPGADSQAEACQLQAGDEVLTVNRHQVAEMSYTDWKSCMEEALQEGSLVMDIRRHGKSSESSERCVCLQGRQIEPNHFKGFIPGLTVALLLLALLNSFDTSNWSVNYCEIIHEWSHDGRWRTCTFFSCLMWEELLCWPQWYLFLPFFSLCAFFLSSFSIFLFFLLYFPLVVSSFCCLFCLISSPLCIHAVFSLRRTNPAQVRGHLSVLFSQC